MTKSVFVDKILLNNTYANRYLPEVVKYNICIAYDEMRMRPTIKDVAREAGVSITTVSHALNGHKDVNENTRKRILEVVKRLEYVPNANGRNLGGIPTKTLALMLVDDLQPTDPSGMTYGLLSGIYAVTQKEGYDFVIITASERKQKEMSFVQLCRQKEITGVVVNGLASDMPYFSQLEAANIPCITVDTQLNGNNTWRISVDNEKASREAVSHLFEQGYRNIAMLGGKKEAQVGIVRAEGYKKALKENGQPIREEWMMDCYFEPEMGGKNAVILKQKYPEIDAFFCVSDRIAIGAIQSLTGLGYRIPEDIGVVGFDDMLISQYYHGGLTSVTQYPYEMGRRSAESLIALINGERIPDWIEMEYVLQKRSTTKRGGEVLQ